jgi:hypothetical protein
MQNQPHYTLTRRILFPYSGEEPLTLRQGLRIIMSWALFFSLSMSFCTLLICVVGRFPPYKTELFLLMTFLIGFFTFAILGWFTVSVSNRSARIRQELRSRKQ